MGQESSEEIAEYTRLALNDLKRQLDESKHKYTVAMPKINAGIFGVPWNLTEQAIKQTGIDCIVYEL
ncbi:hypothetical protein WICPIJ_007960 [Wickerhamomyces pijperi]|nr:hypothetical protein WICPIJ_007960 [Wickerhamomyces pijperi]